MVVMGKSQQWKVFEILCLFLKFRWIFFLYYEIVIFASVKNYFNVISVER